MQLPTDRFVYNKPKRGTLILLFYNWNQNKRFFYKMSCMTNIIFGSIKLATEVILSGKNLSFLYKSESVTAISLVNEKSVRFPSWSFFLSFFLRQGLEPTVSVSYQLSLIWVETSSPKSRGHRFDSWQNLFPTEKNLLWELKLRPGKWIMQISFLTETGTRCKFIQSEIKRLDLGCALVLLNYLN